MSLNIDINKITEIAEKFLIKQINKNKQENEELKKKISTYYKQEEQIKSIYDRYINLLRSIPKPFNPLKAHFNNTISILLDYITGNKNLTEAVQAIRSDFRIKSLYLFLVDGYYLSSSKKDLYLYVITDIFSLYLAKECFEHKSLLFKVAGVGLGIFSFGLGYKLFNYYKHKDIVSIPVNIDIFINEKTINQYINNSNNKIEAIFIFVYNYASNVLMQITKYNKIRINNKQKIG